MHIIDFVSDTDAFSNSWVIVLRSCMCSSALMSLSSTRAWLRRLPSSSATSHRIPLLRSILLRAMLALCRHVGRLRSAETLGIVTVGVVLRSLATAGDDAGVRIAIQIDLMLHTVDRRGHGCMQEAWHLMSSRLKELVRRHGACRRSCSF